MRQDSFGLIGVGRMGEAIAQAVLRFHPTLEALHLSKRSPQRVARLTAQDPRVRPLEPDRILADCDVVILALGRDVARDLLPDLSFQPRHHILSVMAEIPLSELRSLTGGQPQSFSRVLTLPSVADGGQSLPLFPASAAAEAVFGGANRLLPAASETQLLAYWATTGLLSTTMLLGQSAADWLRGQGVENAAAEAYAKALYAEVLGLLGGGFAEGMHHVSTPGGLNVQMLGRIKETGMSEALANGLDEINARLLKSLLSEK